MLLKKILNFKNWPWYYITMYGTNMKDINKYFELNKDNIINQWNDILELMTLKDIKTIRMQKETIKQWEEIINEWKHNQKILYNSAFTFGASTGWKLPDNSASTQLNTKTPEISGSYVPLFGSPILWENKNKPEAIFKKYLLYKKNTKN
jgi:hypothetical protein